MISHPPRSPDRRMLLPRFIWRRYHRRIVSTLAVLASAAVIVLAIGDMAPSTFPTSTMIITVKPGSTLSQSAQVLADNHIVGSPLFYKLLVVLLSGHRQVRSGDYLFDAPESAAHVAFRLIYGIQDLPKIKVTFYEGISTAGMAATLKNAIPKFDQTTFLSLAKPLEGRLFPDTYYFYENSTPQDVVSLMSQTFTEKTKPLLLEIQASGRSAEDIITMSSIVEKEAGSSADRRIIAGILWKRLDQGMPLQVDAPFYYLYGKTSADLTLNDLQANSPYNTYRHTGLPPTPIDNPGYEAIEDTVNPTASDYLYFLSGRDGKMHYAATLDEHVANKRKYLD